MILEGEKLRVEMVWSGTIRSHLLKIRVVANPPTPAEGLKRWSAFVDEQRESIRRYAAQAEPLVRFLTTARAAPALTRRWAGIVDDVANYDQKLAGNGLGALDGFLRDAVPVLVPERDCGGAISTARSAGYLGTVRNELFDDVLKRCRDSARSSLQSRYAAIARSFNQLLAGRFPFSQSLDGTREATPVDLGEFLRLYYCQDGRSLLQQIQGRSCGDDASVFWPPRRAVPGVVVGARTADAGAGFAAGVPREPGPGNGRQSDRAVAAGHRPADVPGRGSGQSGPLGVGRSGTPRAAICQGTRRAGRSGRPPGVGRPPSAPRSSTIRARGRCSVSLPPAIRWRPIAGLRDASPNTLAFDIPVERDAGQPPLGTTALLTPVFRVYIRVRRFSPAKPIR